MCSRLVLALAGVMACTAAVAATDGTTAPSLPMPTPQFRHYQVADGLPSSNVYSVVQDAQGVLWMGTNNGLVRFDDEHFRVFRHDPRNPHSLRGNDINALMIDHRQRLWVGGDSTGLNLYRPATGDFRTWRHVKGDPHSLAGNDIGTLAEGADGSIWVSVMGEGLDRMLPDGRFEHFRHEAGHADSLSSNILMALYVREDGSLLIGGFSGLDRMSKDGHIHHLRFEGLAKSPRVWGIQGRSGHERISTDKGLYRLGQDGVAHRMLANIIPTGLITTSVSTPDGSLWVGSVDGLYWIGANGQHRYFPPRLHSTDGVPGSLIWSLAVDQEGGLWVTTRDGGVAYLCPVWKQFVVFQRQLGQSGQLDIDRVTAIVADRGQLLVGGADGALDSIDPSTGRVKHEHLKLGQDTITALASAGDGALWVGHTQGMQLDVDGHLHRIGKEVFQGGVNRIVTDAQGDAYTSPPVGGVYRVDRSSLAVHMLSVLAGTPSDSDVNNIAMHAGRLWVASQGGLLRQDASGNVLAHVPGITPGRVLAFSFDDGGLWLVRPDHMEHYRLSGGRAIRDREVGVDQGWPEVNVVAMLCDHLGRVWLTTHTGLWRYDPRDGRFRSYGAADGLPSPEFSAHTMAIEPDGTEYSGTMRGVVGWNPDQIRDHARPPRLQLERVTVRRQDTTVALPADGHPIDMRWNDHELRVAAQAISYLDPQRNHYRFRLDGLDSSWVDTGKRGERDFTGLAHGDYTLHVEAAGPSGAWTVLPPIDIHVARPPWTTWWAWMAYLLIALMLIAAASVLARRRIEQRHRVEMAERERSMAEQASAAKTSFLATLGHEIRTPMTGVLGMTELLLRSKLEPRQRGYAETIQRSGTLLLRLVNEALDMARIESGRLELDVTDFDPRELVRDVLQLESGVAEDKGLQLSAQVDASVPGRVRGDALRIKQILLNLVNNALKFTREGRVELKMNWVDEGLSCSVSDTGPGIPEDSRERLFQRFEQAESPQRNSGSGLGLAICRELAALMGGFCELVDSSAQGSTFRVWLPLPMVESESAVAPPPAGHAVRWKLLLVEDDVTVAGVISGLLESRGHHVRHAAQGLAGLAEMEDGDFDAILLDLDLPGLDGFVVARMLRERGVQVPIVAITARSGGDEEAHARESGMDGFLRKPLSGEQLQDALYRLLA